MRRYSDVIAVNRAATHIQGGYGPAFPCHDKTASSINRAARHIESRLACFRADVQVVSDIYRTATDIYQGGTLFADVPVYKDGKVAASDIQRVVAALHHRTNCRIGSNMGFINDRSQSRLSFNYYRIIGTGHLGGIPVFSDAPGIALLTADPLEGDSTGNSGISDQTEHPDKMNHTSHFSRHHYSPPLRSCTTVLDTFFSARVCAYAASFNIPGTQSM